jgi:biotin carboxyl carrier protein
VSNPGNPPSPVGLQRDTPAVAGVVSLGNGAFRIERTDGTQAVAFGVADAARTWVFLDGRTYVIESSPTRRATGAHDPSALTAPMPANVTQVHVAPGQQVHVGDVLITLEAMKMELPIRATTDGVVAAINCRVGELVQPGSPLVELSEARTEPEGEPRTEPEHEPSSENREA